MFTRLVWITLILALSRASRYDRSIIKNRRLANSGQEMVWADLESEIPAHCRNRSLCEDVPNYPHEYVDHLLRNNATVRNAFSFMFGAYEVPMGCKDGQDQNIDELCASTTEVSHPKAAQDSNGRWHYLLPEQFLCLEKCKTDGGHCSKDAIYIKTGYTAICKQKFTRKRMATCFGLFSSGQCNSIPPRKHILKRNSRRVRNMSPGETMNK